MKMIQFTKNMGIYDEMENATPEGQELLKQQYEALEFTLQGYASEFVDTVLVQPGELNPFVMKIQQIKHEPL